MMNYPRNCTLLTEEEMEYTTGGMSVLAFNTCMVGMLVFEFVNIANWSATGARLQKEDPEKYPKGGVKENVALMKDAAVEYASSTFGATMLTLNAAFVAGYAVGMIEMLA